MTFSIAASAAVSEEFRRVAEEQFEGAVSGLATATGDRVDGAVHDARKRCKRLRATFRLVGPALGERRYRRLDALVRDAARELSGARDAAALVAMFDDLVGAHPGVLGADVAAGVRAGFAAGAGGPAGGAGEETSELQRASERLEAAREAARSSKLREDGFDAVRAGLGATYARGRADVLAFRKRRSIELSHDWRKAVKYGWHQVELLEHLAPTVLTPAAAALHALADALGDSHNLAVMADALAADPGRFGGRVPAMAVTDLADASRADLEERAVRLGLRLYAETPKAYLRRLECYWRAAVDAGPELPTGELADVAR